MEEIVKKKSSGKTPQQFLQEMPGHFVTETIASLQDLTELPKPQTNEEIQERINLYFKFCQEREMIPEIEGMATALKTSRKSIYMWSQGRGCDSERQEIIENAKNLIHSFLMQASLRGKVPIPTGIFLMKNWLGYKDTISIEKSYEDEPEQKAPSRTPEEIAASYGSTAELEEVELPE